MVTGMLMTSQVFLVRKIRGVDRGQLYAMKVLKKATLKGKNEKLQCNIYKVKPPSILV